MDFKCLVADFIKDLFLFTDGECSSILYALIGMFDFLWISIGGKLPERDSINNKWLKCFLLYQYKEYNSKFWFKIYMDKPAGTFTEGAGFLVALVAKWNIWGVKGNILNVMSIISKTDILTFILKYYIAFMLL